MLVRVMLPRRAQRGVVAQPLLNVQCRVGNGCGLRSVDTTIYEWMANQRSGLPENIGHLQVQELIGRVSVITETTERAWRCGV
jgi:hypothetical protein